MDDEPHSVCSNGLDKLVLGGKNKMVNIYKVEADKPIELKDPLLAMKLESDVRKVSINGTNWVLGFSNDSYMTMFNTLTKKNIFCKPGHEGCSVKSGSVDPTGRFVATSGSDGKLNIYKFENDQSSVKLMTTVKLMEKKVLPTR